MSDRETPITPIGDPPVQGDFDDPQELPGADPAVDRDRDDPDNGPIGDQPDREHLLQFSLCGARTMTTIA